MDNIYEKIKEKYKNLIIIAEEKMKLIDDYEHDINHMNDVIVNVERILDNIIEDVDKEVCIVSAYWHDVGRIKCKDGHEKESSQMLIKVMREMKYDEEFIKKCSDAIEFHKWDMYPKTIEGLVVKDADKLAWLGSGRWSSCIENKQRLDSIIELLPKLKSEILYFDYSRNLYDEEIIKIVKKLYNKIYDNI